MKIAVTGGAGYVGSMLVPRLLKMGHEVTVLDTFWYGDTLNPHKKLKKLIGDIRQPQALRDAFKGADAVIHLACISNDPSFDLDPKLGREVNYEAFKGILKAVKVCNVQKFIYASSSSVYGVSDHANVTEDHPCKPLTDYSKFKRSCELDLKFQGVGHCKWIIIRPATVCGYAPRLRLDLVVNAMTIKAITSGVIPVHGGGQLRPNINIKDMVKVYEKALEANVTEKVYNAGFENKSLSDIAELVRKNVGDTVELKYETSNDPRSYHINSDKIAEIGFQPTHSISEAISSLVTAKTLHLIKDVLSSKYYNIQKMKELNV